MKILIVAATKLEVQSLIDAMDEVKAGEKLLICKYKKTDIHILITGVGMVATAYHTGNALNNSSYNIALNIGICGSFNKNLKIGDVINVYEDRFSELGAEDGNDFLTLEDLKLEGITKISNSKFQISNSMLEQLPKVNAITVNTTHGNEQSIEKVFRKFHPMIESMEGAAFMFACEDAKISYIQIRAVSNYVEHRNRDNWEIPLAIANLNKKAIELLNSL